MILKFNYINHFRILRDDNKVNGRSQIRIETKRVFV